MRLFIQSHRRLRCNTARTSLLCSFGSVLSTHVCVLRVYDSASGACLRSGLQSVVWLQKHNVLACARHAKLLRMLSLRTTGGLHAYPGNATAATK